MEQINYLTVTEAELKANIEEVTKEIASIQSKLKDDSITVKEYTKLQEKVTELFAVKLGLQKDIYTSTELQKFVKFKLLTHEDQLIFINNVLPVLQKYEIFPSYIAVLPDWEVTFKHKYLFCFYKSDGYLLSDVFSEIDVPENCSLIVNARTGKQCRVKISVEEIPD